MTPLGLSTAHFEGLLVVGDASGPTRRRETLAESGAARRRGTESLAVKLRNFELRAVDLDAERQFRDHTRGLGRLSRLSFRPDHRTDGRAVAGERVRGVRHTRIRA